MKKTITILMTLMIAITFINVVQANNDAVIKPTIANYEPIPAEPGQIHDVWVTFENLGSSDATNLEVEFIDTYPFTLVDETDRKRTINTVRGFGDYTLRYKVLVEDEAIDGESELLFKFTHSNLQFEQTTSLPLTIRSPDTQLLVQSAKTNPQTVRPGQNFDMTINLENNANTGLVRDLLLTLNLEDVRLQGEQSIRQTPFAPSGESNQKSAGRITAGNNEEFTFSMTAYPNANAGLYKVPLKMDYVTRNGEKTSREVTLAIQVGSEPDFLVTLDSTNLHTESSSGEVTFSIVNKGLTEAKFLNVILEESDDYTILERSSEYIGNLETDDFDNVRFQVNPQTNEPKYKITLQYMDAFNNELSKEVVIHERLQEENQETSFIWLIALVLVLLLAGLYIWRKSNKSKQ